MRTGDAVHQGSPVNTHFPPLRGVLLGWMPSRHVWRSRGPNSLQSNSYAGRFVAQEAVVMTG